MLIYVCEYRYCICNSPGVSSIYTEYRFMTCSALPGQRTMSPINYFSRINIQFGCVHFALAACSKSCFIIYFFVQWGLLHLMSPVSHTETSSNFRALQLCFVWLTAGSKWDLFYISSLYWTCVLQISMPCNCGRFTQKGMQDPSGLCLHHRVIYVLSVQYIVTI